MNFTEKVKVKRAHSVVVGDAGEKVHENQLTVALATVAGFLLSSSLNLRPAFHHNDRRSPPASDGLKGRR